MNDMNRLTSNDTHTKLVMRAALAWMERTSPHFWHSTQGILALRSMYALGNLELAKSADDCEVAS